MMSGYSNLRDLLLSMANTDNASYEIHHYIRTMKKEGIKKQFLLNEHIELYKNPFFDSYQSLLAESMLMNFADILEPSSRRELLQRLGL